MSTVDYNPHEVSTNSGVSVPLRSGARALHRLAEARRLEGISQSTVARRLGVSLSEVKWQENEATDLPVSALYDWQEVLEVPVGELLLDKSNNDLSGPVMKRAQMIRLMKTARAISLRCRETSIQRMAKVLVDQLVELMPELEDVTAWPDVGQPRTLSELGQVVHRRLSDDALGSFADTA